MGIKSWEDYEEDKERGFQGYTIILIQEKMICFWLETRAASGKIKMKKKNITNTNKVRNKKMTTETVNARCESWTCKTHLLLRYWSVCFVIDSIWNQTILNLSSLQRLPS